MPLLPNPAVVTPAVNPMTLICSSVLGGSQAQFDTNTILGGNIPATYNHLLYKCYLRGDIVAVVAAVQMQLNNDSGANYSNQFIAAASTTANAGENIAATSSRIGRCPGSTAPANEFSSVVGEIPVYAGAVNHKAFSTLSASREGTGSGAMALEQEAGAWFAASAAVTRMRIFPASGNFVAGSAFYLYGLL